MARILVVEDDRLLAGQLALALENLDHEVAVSYNGAQALAQLGLEPAHPAAPVPDLLLLDVMMPTVNGVVVCERLSADARFSRMPILVISGRSETRGAFRHFRNVLAYFDKPFESKRLLDAVSIALAEKL